MAAGSLSLRGLREPGDTQESVNAMPFAVLSFKCRCRAAGGFVGRSAPKGKRPMFVAKGKRWLWQWIALIKQMTTYVIG